MATSKIGFWTLTAIVAGNLIGSGIFLLPTSLAPYGPAALCGWIGSTVGALLLSYVFAYLSAACPQTGGPYVYARAAFGDTVGFFTCWGYWVLSWVSNPALAIGAVGYLQTLTGPLSPQAVFGLEVCIVALVTALNLGGIAFAGRLEVILTVLKVIPLLVLPLLGMWVMDFSSLGQGLHHLWTAGFQAAPDHPHGFFWSHLGATTFLTLWAFVGLETGTVPAGDVVNARKVVGRATTAGTLMAAAVYCAGSVMILGAVPLDQLTASLSPYGDAASILFGGHWGGFIGIVAVITCIGTLNGWTLIVGRIPLGAAADGLFPAIFARTTPKGTPHVGILVSAIVSSPFLLLSLQKSLLDQFHVILDVAITLILIIYAIAVAAFFVIARRRGDLTPARAALGGLACLFVLWALCASSPLFIALSLGIVLSGYPVWWWMNRRPPHRTPQ